MIEPSTAAWGSSSVVEQDAYNIWVEGPIPSFPTMWSYQTVRVCSRLQSRERNTLPHYAGVAELTYATVLKTVVERHMGLSPITSTEV